MRTWWGRKPNMLIFHRFLLFLLTSPYPPPILLSSSYPPPILPLSSSCPPPILLLPCRKSKIQRKSYRTNTEHLSKVQRTPMEHPTNIYRTSYANPPFSSPSPPASSYPLHLHLFHLLLQLLLQRKSIGNPMNVYRNSNEHISNIQRTSIECPTNIQRTSNESRSNIQRTSIEHPTRIYRTSNENSPPPSYPLPLLHLHFLHLPPPPQSPSPTPPPTKVYRTSSDNLSNIQRTSIEHPTGIHQTWIQKVKIESGRGRQI